jgi:hypothetical protein
MLSTFYPIIQTVVIYAMLFFVIALIMRLIFNYSDRIRSAASADFHTILKKPLTDSFIRRRGFWRAFAWTLVWRRS